jgi:hypothetical protein
LSYYKFDHLVDKEIVNDAKVTHVPIFGFRNVVGDREISVPVSVKKEKPNQIPLTIIILNCLMQHA